MNNTPYNTRSSEWIGDMAVWMRQNSEDNSIQLERLRRNLRIAREQELTPRQKQVLELYYDQHLTISEIALQLHVNPSTVCRTLQRARQRLHRCLQYTF